MLGCKNHTMSHKYTLCYTGNVGPNVFSEHVDCQLRVFSYNTDNFRLPVQMQLSEKLRTTSGLFIAFLELALNFELFEKKLSLIAQVFLKLLTSKDVFT